MRTIFGLTIALAVGISLTALGVTTFLYGLGQPIGCRTSNVPYRGGCGNLPEVAGAFMIMGGLVTVVGSIAYAMRVWEHSDSELEDD